jgi:molybdate transport system substrate-binding protein
MALNLLCAGAAKGLVDTLAPRFEAESGVAIAAAFGAVGAIREKLAAGEPCDVIVLTAALIGELERDGRVVPGTSAALGRVHTGIAVRAGDRMPDIHDGVALREALLAASGILVPDPERATAGIHFVGVLKRLSIHAAVESRIRAYPNGATAMQALAQAAERGCIGCTQVSEILYTPGVALVGVLAPGFELATVYSAAVSATAREPGLARRFVVLLAGAASRAVRSAAGFEA